MIPVSLTLQGIYSFQEPQTIDFQKLTDAKLFGIFGNVGSGKSTILEAITFALYGESERLNKRENRYYNMMNLKSGELLIDFVFQSGKEDQQYRFIVQGKRNKTHFEKINKFERRAYELKDGQWQPLESASAEPILGLSYENFKRTIIIPQGKFQEFLQLTDKERTQMLKEIFNLDRFELSDKVGVLEKQNSNELIRVEEQLNGLEEASEESRKEKQEELKTIETNVNTLSQSHQKLQDYHQKLKALKDLNDKLSRARQELVHMEQAKPDMDKRQKILEDYRNCRYYFAESINKVNALEKEGDQLTAAVQNLERQKKDKDKEILDKKRELTRIQQQFPDQDHLKESIADLKTIIEIFGFRETLAKLQKQYTEAENREEEQQKKLENHKKTYQNLNHQVEELKQEKLDAGTIGEVKNWFTQKQSLLQNIQSYEQEVKQADEQIAQLAEKRKSALTDHGLTELREGILEMPVSELVPFLEEQYKELEKKQEEIDGSLHHYRVREELQSYASSLQDGDPCPVCGSTHHPDKLDSGDVQLQKKQFEEKRQKTRNQIKAIDKALRAIEGLKESYKIHKNQKESNEKRLKEAREQLAAHEKAFQWSDFQGYSEEAIDELTQKAKEQTKEIERLEKQLKQAEQKLEQEEQALKKQAEQKQEVKRQVSNYEERIKSYQQQLKHLSIDVYQETSREGLEKQAKEWEQMLQLYQELEKSIEALEKEGNELNYGLKHKTQQRDDKKAELKRAKDELDHLVHQSRYENLGQIQRILDQNLDVEQEESTLKTFYDQYNQQAGAVKSLESELAEKEPFDAEEFEKTSKALQEAEEQLQEARSQKAVLEQTLKDLDQKLARKKDLNQKHERLQNRQENIRTLKNLFKGSGFVKYVSSVFLKQLCYAANQRFRRLTCQQLRLEVTEDNNFQVRDYLNNGRVRNVKTLSGGQTFQASLSLALALAENIQHLSNANQNFFFLDEGFGSQDEESLAIVFETLKSLRKENRIVGVISHVEELKETIDVSLTIYNDPETGSRVKGSWEMA